MVGDILQPTHLLFILVIALLVLGPKRLPEVGKSLGKGLRDFRMAISGEEQHPQNEFVSEPAVEAAPLASPQPVTPETATPQPATTEPVSSEPVTEEPVVAASVSEPAEPVS